MARVKGAMMTRKRRNATLKLAKGYWGSKSKHFKMAKQQVMKSGNYAFAGRKMKKRDFRRLWITRISAAVAPYGLNYSNLLATKFNFNTSILVLVFVVLGGLGNIRGSIIAAAILTVLPELLRSFADYRMLVYAIVLILVMLGTNNTQLKNLLAKIIPTRSRKEAK